MARPFNKFLNRSSPPQQAFDVSAVERNEHLHDGKALLLIVSTEHIDPS